MATRRTFRGTDRRILNKIKKAFALVSKRDTLAQGTRRTSAISTRELMFPPTDSVLIGQRTAVLARIDACLAMTTVI